jgi:hypothetical protein
MNWPLAFTSLGLILDIAGVSLLFRFPPPELGVGIGWVTGAAHEAELAREKTRRSRFSKLSLALLVTGFALQLVGNRWLPLSSWLS